MKKFLNRKIAHWRSLPELDRMRLARRLTWTAGVVLVGLWLLVLLPFQLFVTRDRPAEPAIQGVNTTPTPTPTPTLDPFAP